MTQPGMFYCVDRATLLVVDDDAEIRELIDALLGDEYDMYLADSGAKALEIARSDAPPDLILLDVMMPDMDGYEVCRRLQQNPATRDIPIIFLTAKDDAEDEAIGFGLGAVDYIAKPISFPILLARVRNTVALAQRTARLKSLSEKLSKYLAPQIYRSIFEGAHDTRIQTRRKKLTVFFSDIKGFTEIAESLNPEDLTRILNEYFSEMSGIALDYGATIDKFIGDAMLIFVGDPKTLGEQEDALQCVRMAIAMQRHMATLQEKWRKTGFDQPLRMRIGINTGFCDVGNFGCEQRMEYTIIGAQVNLAQRLEQACEPGGILLSGETHALVGGEIGCAEHAPVMAKGIAREIPCFSVNDIQVQSE